MLPVLSQAPKGRQMLGDTERVFRAHLSEAVRGHPVMFTAVTTLDVTSVACPCGMQGIIVFFVAFNTCASFSAMRALDSLRCQLSTTAWRTTTSRTACTSVVFGVNCQPPPGAPPPRAKRALV